MVCKISLGRIFAQKWKITYLRGHKFAQLLGQIITQFNFAGV